MSTEQKPEAQSSRPKRQASTLVMRTLLLGKGQPRLRLGALLMLLIWFVITWLLYPYALSVAALESNVRLIGLVLLFVVAFAVYKILSNLGRLVWHLGLLWLVAIVLASFVGATVARGRVIGARGWTGWSSAGVQVASETSQRLQGAFERLLSAPADIYLATTGEAPFWRPGADGSAEAATLEQPADSPQLVLASEQDPAGITQGVIVMAVSEEGASINLRRTPTVDAEVVGQLETGTLLFVTGGPVEADNRIWWQVSDIEAEGWCVEDVLRLESR